MSYPPAGGDNPPPAPGGTVYGNPYGSPPAPQQYDPNQPAPTLHQPTVSDGAPGYGGYQPAAPGQPGYAPGAAPVPPPGQPMSAPPVSVPPVSGPGYVQPMSVPPASAPPVSGPGFGPPPMSGPPGPYGPAGAAPATGGGKRWAALVLGLVAALLLVFGGVMTFLYVSTNGELNESRQTVSQRDGTISANQQEMEKLKGELKTVQERLSDTQQDLTGTKNDRDEQARQKKVIASCLDKLTTAIAAASRGDRAAFEAANKGLDKVCDEAENYL
ncbi:MULTISPECIES: hypothetical protein [unclassified Micromonospora]|uniref:hypothetical protein n=1 Tax=unclassified Micromonospora TaxID=2617518 RepID=UPI001C232269|nr:MULTISPECIES: hypothetical protein [unclassified Micromonospora]MBU8859632.1 hypothetical protein [Micromonospora sp. WMMB482]MDM4779148.1 hypothetical protein [Micromonospora sp. b486]